MKHSVLLSILLFLAMGLLFSGCNQSQPVTQEEPVTVQPAIMTDCIVQYFKSDASAYITQQQHGYNPDEGFFRAVSSEPVGTVKCSLHNNIFETSNQKRGSLSDLPHAFWSKNLAASVFYSFCAGGDLLATDTMASVDNVKIEGRWYASLRPQWPTEPTLTLLRSLETGQIELVLLDNVQDGQKWLVRNYNLRYSKDLSRRLPRTIDIFDIRNGVASKELMIRFDYKDIQKSQMRESLN